MTISGPEHVEKKTEELDPSSALAAKSSDYVPQIFSPKKFITHHPKSGLNPLTDAAAYVFSIVGKLKQLKSYRNLAKLHQELVQAIHAFQETVKGQGYSSEYVLVSRYALCATLDDVISNTSWGGLGQWEHHSLLAAFSQEPSSPERFFVILERISKDPALYIDLMELMYICLSLGFKGNHRATEYNNNQLEQIITILYKRIRAHQGNFTRSLSPFPLKATSLSSTRIKNLPSWFIFLLTGGLILFLFAGFGYMLDNVSTQIYQELMHIGKSILYEDQI